MLKSHACLRALLAACALCLASVASSKDKYTPGNWKGVNWMTPSVALKEMDTGSAVGVVFFYNPSDRNACRAWEVTVFEKVAKDLKGLEGRAIFTRVDTSTQEDLPEAKDSAKEWKSWCGSKKDGKTYVRILYSDGSALQRLSSAPAPADSFLKTLESAIKKNESYVARQKSKKESAEKAAQKKTEKKEGEKKPSKADSEKPEGAGKEAEKETK